MKRLPSKQKRTLDMHMMHASSRWRAVVVTLNGANTMEMPRLPDFVVPSSMRSYGFLPQRRLPGVSDVLGSTSSSAGLSSTDIGDVRHSP